MHGTLIYSWMLGPPNTIFQNTKCADSTWWLDRAKNCWARLPLPWNAKTAKWAATGLAAAWLLSHFAGFRITTFYLSEPASLQALQNELHLRADLPGANLWLVVPNDDGVFQGSLLTEGIQCVHPVQVWLDLKGHPERAPEAAGELRARFGWKMRAR